MFTTLIRKYIDLIKRIDTRQDDEIIVKRFEHFNDVLQPGESIIWQGKPSAKHAWGDHDQMEPAGSVSERPVSLSGRKVEMILALVFILFMFLMGLVSTYAGIDELLHNKEMGTQALGIFLILTGITFMSGLPFLMRPIFNSLRTRQLTYLLTSTRAMIIRRGHAWAEIWTRSWVILSVSLLLLYGVILFSGIFIESSHQDIVDGAGMSTWLARLFILLIMAPVGFIFAALGFVGLYFQSVIILDAIKDRHGIFMRAFDFDEIKRNDFPVISRPRKEGVGDVILGQDGHWEYDIDFNQAPWFKINAVGFLSVPHAKQVMAKVERTLSR
ncbi:MAG: hypothetical protein KZQ75_01760 [Candidatus Thiodiazotropha sp. (ex Myrtea spinifera)]|nr:hypothetical protein [Candidatus Thiodiazotropha sp. (ex Myrtea spinifera)]MCU7828573.1 hypothetical protein [Candidatus Thiodiazotropha sp. (ex Myrtea sp. 'scaly one' KF741663)]